MNRNLTQEAPLQKLEFKKLALQHWSELSWPQRQQEAWKYLSLKNFQQESFAPIQNTEHLAKPEELSLFGSIAEKMENYAQQFPGDEILFVSHTGIFKHLNSNRNNTLQVSQLDQDPCLNAKSDNFIQAMNNSSAYKTIKISALGQHPQRLHMVFLTQHLAPSKNIQALRLWLDIQPQSHLTLVESYLLQQSTEPSTDQTQALSVQVFADVLEQAQLKWIRWQGLDRKYFFSHTNVNLKEAALFQHWNVQLGSVLSRQEVNIFCQQEKCSADLKVVTATDASEIVDFYTHIRHQAEHCLTHQHHKNILNDKSKSNFLGQVFIEKSAQKAKSEQLNNNLMLSDHCEVNSRPVLDILADDVKATHGSTVGQINTDELFYLQSRGLSKSTAMQMLTAGYALDIIQTIPDSDIQKYTEFLIKKKIQKWINC